MTYASAWMTEYVRRYPTSSLNRLVLFASIHPGSPSNLNTTVELGRFIEIPLAAQAQYLDRKWLLPRREEGL